MAWVEVFMSCALVCLSTTANANGLNGCIQQYGLLTCNMINEEIRIHDLRTVERMVLRRVEKWPANMKRENLTNLKSISIEKSPKITCATLNDWNLDINITITVNRKRCGQISETTTLSPSTKRPKRPKRPNIPKTTIPPSTSTTDSNGTTEIITSTSSSINPMFDAAILQSGPVGMIISLLVIGMSLGAFFTGFGVFLCLERSAIWSKCCCRPQSAGSNRSVEIIGLQNLPTASSSEESLFRYPIRPRSNQPTVLPPIRARSNQPAVLPDTTSHHHHSE